MSEYESPDLLNEVDRPYGRAVTKKLPVERHLQEDAAQSPAISESRDHYHGTLSGGASSIKTTDLRTSDTSPLFPGSGPDRLLEQRSTLPTLASELASGVACTDYT